MVAYLDAGTGSMVIGVVAAGVAGAGVAVRSTLGKLRRKGKAASSEGEAGSAEGGETTETAH
jgi:hypothetical protein